MTSVSSYQYQLLKPGEVRLMQLLPPNPLDPDDPIRLHIIHTSFARCRILDSFFSYEAVSYVWGGDRSDRVYCDDHEILVPPNLVPALLRLRETMPVYPGFHRTLWVDSICINQDDIVERGHQVRLMEDIYSHATRVIIWLGGSPEVEGHLTRIRQGHLPPYSIDYSIDSRLEYGYLQTWGRLVAKVFDQPWFERMWVIQEVVFAAKAIVSGGSSSIKWSKLVDAALTVRENPHTTALQRTRCDAVLGIQCLRNQIQQERSLHSTPLPYSNIRPSKRSRRPKPILELDTFARKPEDLLELAELFRSNAATDPRDKIYALLGLASALKTDRFASRIDADYIINTRDLFVGFARLVISGPSALRLLRNVHDLGEQSFNLPSWVPDWSISLRVRPLAELCKAQYLLPRQRAILLQQPSPDVLKLVGKRIDTIKAVGEVLEESSGEASLRTWHSWISLGKECGLAAPSGFLLSNFSVPLGDEGYERYQNDMGLWVQRRKDIPKHWSEICLGRRYLLTEQKRSGLVPAGARVGHEVILFPGAELPFIMSRDESDGMFRIIGQCYLDRVSLEHLLHKKKYKTDVYYVK